VAEAHGKVMDKERLEHARAEAREIISRVQTDPSQVSSLLPDSIEELHALPNEQLVARHDVLAGEARRYLGIDRTESMRFLELSRDFAGEITRRETARQGERMEALTRSLNSLTVWIVGLTVLIAIATVIGVALTAWALLSGA
jgi:hypothetical protein